MNSFKKRMKNNWSHFPTDHIHPLQILENMNHPMIPKLISYDNETYTCERIEGMPLEKYVQKTRDPAFALKLMHDINDFMRELTTHTKAFKENDGPLVNYQLFCDDMHCDNLIITEDGKVYIIDLDQFGFHHPYSIFKFMETASQKLNRSIWGSLVTGEIKHINSLEKKHKRYIVELEKRLLDYV